MVERLHQRDKEKWKSICERNGKVKGKREREMFKLDSIMVERFVLDGDEEK